MTNINILIREIVSAKNKSQQALKNLNSDTYKSMKNRSKNEYNEIIEMLSEIL